MDYRVSSLSQQWEEATPLLKAILPRFLYDFVGDILGGYNTMDLWKGHSKK